MELESCFHYYNIILLYTMPLIMTLTLIPSVVNHRGFLLDIGLNTSTVLFAYYNTSKAEVFTD